MKKLLAAILFLACIPLHAQVYPYFPPAALGWGTNGQCFVSIGAAPGSWGSCSNNSAAGSAGQFQYNSGGSFAGTTGLSLADGTTPLITVSNTSTNTGLGQFTYTGTTATPLFYPTASTVDLIIGAAGAQAGGVGSNGYKTTMIIGKSGDWAVYANATSPTYFFEGMVATSRNWLGVLNNSGNGIVLETDGSSVSATQLNKVPTGLACPCNFLSDGLKGTSATNNQGNISIVLNNNVGNTTGANGIFGGYIDSSHNTNLYGYVDHESWISVTDPSAALWSETIGDSSTSTNVLYLASGAPTVSSGFGSTPSIGTGGIPSSFSVNVGTGGSASSGVIGLPTVANGWTCMATDQSHPGGNWTEQSSSSTSSVTLTNYNSSGSATAWTASDILVVSCFAH